MSKGGCTEHSGVEFMPIYSQILALRVKDLSDERIVALRFDDEVDMRGSHWGSVEAAKDIACWAIEGDLENR